jgi:hypothetical protein
MCSRLKSLIMLLPVLSASRRWVSKKAASTCKNKSPCVLANQPALEAVVSTHTCKNKSPYVLAASRLWQLQYTLTRAKTRTCLCQQWQLLKRKEEEREGILGCQPSSKKQEKWQGIIALVCVGAYQPSSKNKRSAKTIIALVCLSASQAFLPRRQRESGKGKSGTGSLSIHSGRHQQ